MGIDCNNPKNDQEKQMCACVVATETMKKAYENYEERYTEYLKEAASYTRWLQSHNDWKQLTGAFEQIKPTINSREVTFNKETGWYNDCNSFINTSRANQECQKNDLWDSRGFYAYDDYTSGGTGPCAWKHLRCKRTDASKNGIDQFYKELEPQTDPGTTQVWLNKAPPSPPNVPATSHIQCCSQLFNEIKSGGNTDISNITQQCTQKLNEAINKSDDPPPANTASPPANNVDSRPKYTGGNISQMELILIIVIVILFLLCISILIGIYINGSNGGSEDGFSNRFRQFRRY